MKKHSFVNSAFFPWAAAVMVTVMALRIASAGYKFGQWLYAFTH